MLGLFSRKPRYNHDAALVALSDTVASASNDMRRDLHFFYDWTPSLPGYQAMLGEMFLQEQPHLADVYVLRLRRLIDTLRAVPFNELVV